MVLRMDKTLVLEKLDDISKLTNPFLAQQSTKLKERGQTYMVILYLRCFFSLRNDGNNLGIIKFHSLLLKSRITVANPINSQLGNPS